MFPYLPGGVFYVVKRQRLAEYCSGEGFAVS